MSYAIYGESDTYVFLVTGETPAHALSEFMDDVDSCGVLIRNVYNIYAVTGRQEAVELENAVNAIIANAIKEVE
ncbi:hypothetical protein D3C75_448260 [compost metagenome]